MRLDNVVDVDKNLYPVEDDDLEELEVQEGSYVKPLKSPSAPSRQEMLEHSITHYPFRSWCVHCTRGKCKASQHKISGGSEASEVPIVGFDYAFPVTAETKVKMTRRMLMMQRSKIWWLMI